MYELAASIQLPTEDNKLTLLFDGGSTSTIVQDEANCSNVRAADIKINVGGGHVVCKKVGDFYFEQFIDGRRVQTKRLARIVPNFGIDIISEAGYLANGCKVEKEGLRADAMQNGKSLFSLL